MYPRPFKPTAFLHSRGARQERNFRASQPGAIAQRSCYSTEDLLARLSFPMCNVISHTEPAPPKSNLLSKKISPLYPTTIRTAYGPARAFAFFASTALFVFLNLIALRPGSYISTFQPDDFHGLVPEVTASHVHRPRTQECDSFISPDISFTKRYAAKKHLYPKHTSRLPTSSHAEKKRSAK